MNQLRNEASEPGALGDIEQGKTGMGLQERLRRLTGEDKAAEGTTPADRQAKKNELQKRLDALLLHRPVVPGGKVIPHRQRRNGPALEDLLSGCEEVNRLGSYFKIELRREGTECHGSRKFSELERLNMEAAALLADDARLSAFDSRKALFLDTETTGLSGGTGTLAFLVGLGWFDEEGRFVVRQLFARNFAEERAVLAALAETASSKRYLISFNGKAFDTNLLATRYILNKMENPLTALPHLDLLHPARRLFSHRIENSRLITLEEKLLGFYREGDLPGSEVPLRYFNWLRSSNPYPMLDVFRHNGLDITALAALTVHLTEIFDSDGGSPHYASADFCAAARLCQDRGRPAEACSLLENLSRSSPQKATLEARQSLSLIYKRSSHWEKAVEIWEDLLQDNPENLFAVEELAKWLEHRERDFESAFRLVDNMMKKVPGLPEQEKEAWLHRHSRLQGRCRREHSRRSHG